MGQPRPNPSLPPGGGCRVAARIVNCEVILAQRGSRALRLKLLLVWFVAIALCGPLVAAPGEKAVWKPVEFAILRYNDDAPASWNMYHGEKRGLLLIRLWRRYLLVNIQEQEVYEVDPSTVKSQGDNAEWSPSDVPTDPIETSEWKVRDVGPMRRVRFRFGKTGNFLDIQLPLLPNGRPAYLFPLGDNNY
jgi:hypothetical protein